MGNFIELLTVIGGVCGSIVTIVGFIALLRKKPKQWVENMMRNTFDSQIDSTLKEVSEKIGQLQDSLEDRFEQNDETQKCILRHSILDIYETHKKDKKLPPYVREDLHYLYERYSKLHGNSFVQSIYEEMSDWKDEN